MRTLDYGLQFVSAVPWCISSLLTTPVLGFPVCEWVSSPAVFKPIDNTYLFILQQVSGYYALFNLKAC